LRIVSRQRYYPEREDAVIDLDGWLELPWNNAPLLIITGMNEGCVPDSQLSDVFLPDSLRSQLNLRHDAHRLARDAYMMCQLIESRREDGRVCLIVGKTGATGELLKPSRLLFRCEDEELPRRAARLFGDPEESRDNYPSTISFRLDVRPPADLRLRGLQKMPVAWFKDYLACPFRFYLRRILGMEELDDQKTEMDALDFGSLVHYVLQRMAENNEMSQSKNMQELREFLWNEAESWIVKRFGRRPPLQVELQLDAARQRLEAAARVQAQLVREGWEILYSEFSIDTHLNGMIVSGRIDRIDRHRQTGWLRLLDYKTSDKSISPEDDHFTSPASDAPDFTRVSLGGREKRWRNLQLPLYRILLSGREEFRGTIDLGYFNLPKALNDTGVVLWKGFNDELLESARHCAGGVIEHIRNRRFWPPATKILYDDFEHLFHGNIPDCIDVEAFESFLKAGKR